MILTHWWASSEGISSETRWTATDRVVVYYITTCFKSTRARTGICTFLIITRLILRTLRTHDTLWPTCWRTSYVPCQAWAYSLPINFTTLTVWSTRWWAAWLCHRWNCRNRIKTELRKVKITENDKCIRRKLMYKKACNT